MQNTKYHAQDNWLPKRNNRWKWMAGASAATAAAATGAQAQIVQITLVDNQVQTFVGVNLNPDLTGTGPTVARLTGRTNLFDSSARGTAALGLHVGTRGISANAHAGSRVTSNSTNRVFARVRSINQQNVVVKSAKASGASGSGHISASLLIPLTITSSNVNGGAPTNALLEVEAFGQYSNGETVALTRLVYDLGDPTISEGTLESDVSIGSSYTVIGSTLNGDYTPAEVPEPSSLALLALGAGGLLARRRLQKAA